MPNANEDMAPMAQPDAMPEPVDLAQAFKMLNQADREAAEEPVENTGAGENEPPVDAGTGDDGAGGQEASAEPGSEQLYGAGDGGPSDGIEAIDFNAYKQQMLRDIQRDAANQVRREFAEQNIGYYSVAELTVRDEQTGQVRFRNPDVQDERDPNYYFKSRAELQQFCEAWNKGVDFEYRKAVNEKQGELLQEAAPSARLMDFFPKWQAMDQVTKDVFDQLLEGHEIRNAAGKEIGYDVNLDAVANQAAKIAARFSQRQAQPQEGQGADQVAGDKAQVRPGTSGPALDMKTGNGKSDDEKEPTSIGEALKMFDKQNRKVK